MNINAETILSLFILVLVGVFIFLFNSMAMRRRQLDHKIHAVTAVLFRRREIASEILHFEPATDNIPLSDKISNDQSAALQIAELAHGSVDEALESEYRNLGDILAQILPECRAELARYNALVEKPETRYFTRLCRFKPRERF
ncbi:MAG: hypothetical protein LBM70_08490 [Victivallales bacterium]|jgi:hypothetical protein|nr:hypothetical protein [Victivallales bacterium]